jgi:ADP-heptose:LPS heptosyltransferase
MSRLLAYRNYSGIGDWIMGLTVLKMVNQQYPDMEIYLNLMTKNAHKRQKQYKVVSPFIRESIKGFDVNITGVTFFENVKTHMNEFDYVSNLKYHKREGLFYIESMVNNFNRLTGLSLQYDPAVYAQYQGEVKNIISEPYILIQACSKRNHQYPAWKDYGVKNMQQIVNHLKNSYKIYQIGGKTGPTLDGVEKHFRELSLSELHSAMLNCQAFVGLDGMLGVYAAHHAIKQFIIYSGKFNMNWTKFPYRTQINGNKNNLKAIGQTVANLLLKEAA